MHRALHLLQILNRSASLNAEFGTNQQEEYHKIKSFNDEYNEFLEKNGLERLIDSFGKAKGNSIGIR